MRVFVAGGTGVVGSRLVRRLVAEGHDVAGSSRTEQGAAEVARRGAQGIVMDARDDLAVREAVTSFSPHIVVHQLTAIGPIDTKHFDVSFAASNVLRTAGTDHLIAATKAVSGARIVAQSFTGWTNPGGSVSARPEHDGFDPHPDSSATATMEAIQHLEHAVSAAEGVVVRYGHLYGPGTAFAPGGDTHHAVTQRRFPVVGGGTGVWSFVHVDDAVEATILAMDGPAAVFNVVDDEPAPVREWLPSYADEIGAKAPKTAPAWLARWLIGRQGVRLMTDSSGSSNRKARSELGWTPAHPSWRGRLGEGAA